jgi:hypothetical protein
VTSIESPLEALRRGMASIGDALPLLLLMGTVVSGTRAIAAGRHS